MTAIELKEAALYFLRFERKLTHIATEFGQYSADVVGASSTRLVELETKVTLSDLKNDFNKRHKHESYANPNRYDYIREDLPNYFYFMVPNDLGEEANNLCGLKNVNYGVITYGGHLGTWDQRWKVIRKAKKLHTQAPSEKVLTRLASRMANEIVSAHMLKHRVNEMRTAMVKELKNRFESPSEADIFEEEA